MSDLGDRAAGSTVVFNFTTTVNGVGTTLSGTPVISAYKNSLTESTAGIVLTVDYDSRTGLNHVVVTTSTDATFYAAGNDYSLVITAGTVGGMSSVGDVVGHFSLGLGNASNVENLDAAGLGNAQRAIARGVVTAGATTTSVPTSSFLIGGSTITGVVTNQFANRVMLFDGSSGVTQGLRGAAAAITANSTADAPTFTVGTLPATPASGDTFSII